MESDVLHAVEVPAKRGVSPERSAAAKAGALKRYAKTDASEGDLHPLLKGLVAELPKPGSVWPEDKREAWSDLATAMFRTLYKSTG